MLRDLDGNLLFSAAMEYYEYYDDEGNFDPTQGDFGYGDEDCGDDTSWTMVGENDLYPGSWTAMFCEYELCVDEPGCYIAHTYWGEYPRGESWSLNGEYCNGAKFPYGYTPYPYISWPDEYMYYYEYENSYQYIALGDDVDRSCQTCCEPHYYEYYFVYDSESEYIGGRPNLVEYYLEETLTEDEDSEWVSVIDGECTDNLCFEDVSGDDCEWYDDFLNAWCDWESGLCEEVYEGEEASDDDVVCADGECTWYTSVEDICNWGEGRSMIHRYKIGLASDNCCACIMWGVSAPEEEEEEEEDEEVKQAWDLVQPENVL